MKIYKLIKEEEEMINIDNVIEDSNDKKFLLMEDGYTIKDIELTRRSGLHLPSKSPNNVGCHDNIAGGNRSSTTTGASKRQRLVSLDVFRGITVAVMILVDYAGGLLPGINHSPWNGVTIADFVMPFFLFMVGVSLGLTYEKLIMSSSRAIATKKAILRASKLLLVGLVLDGGYLHGLGDLTYGVDIQKIRWTGILQRIAVAYLVTALCEIWLIKLPADDASDVNVNKYSRKLSLLVNKYRFQWVLTLVLTIAYASMLYGLYVPDWEYQIPIIANTNDHQSSYFSPSPPPKAFLTAVVKCGFRGDIGPACNAVGMIDRKILGIQHLYKRRPIYSRTKECSINSPDYGPLPPNAPSWCQAPFDPEGLLSSVMAIVTCFIGLHYGHIILHFKNHKDRILSWIVPAFGLVILGFILDLCGMHINKALYSISYTFVTAGAAGILFTGTYVMVDVFGIRRPTKVLEWMGMHALMIYTLAACNVLPFLLQGLYWKKPENNILRIIGIGR